MPPRPVLLVLLGLGCGAETGPVAEPAVLHHDFGTIPHGELRTHEFRIDLDPELGPLVPITYRGDCTCTTFQLVLRGPDGTERIATGYRVPRFAVGPDEELLLRLTVDTNRKEPVDMPPLTVAGNLILQAPTGATPPVVVRVDLTYAIDAPVRIEPSAHIEFPAMPRGRAHTIPTRIYSDRDPPLRLGPVHSSDPRLQGRVVGADGYALLETTLTTGPDEPARNLRATLIVDTDLDGYRLEIPVSGQILPDIEVVPMNKISLGRFDFDQPGAEGFVTLTDHVRDRDPGFRLHAVRDDAGADASRHFAVRLEPIAGAERDTRVWVEYRGGLTGPFFRGEIVLSKAPDQGPFIPIELVAFDRDR